MAIKIEDEINWTIIYHIAGKKMWFNTVGRFAFLSLLVSREYFLHEFFPVKKLSSKWIHIYTSFSVTPFL